jgi:hypothetical protein
MLAVLWESAWDVAGGAWGATRSSSPLAQASLTSLPPPMKQSTECRQRDQRLHQIPPTRKEKAGDGWVIEVMSRKRETRIREDAHKLAFGYEWSHLTRSSRPAPHDLR